MGDNIKTVFERHCSKVRVDLKLIKQIKDYGDGFINRNEDHIFFFGGNSIGVYPVRFKTSDRYEWIIDVLDIDEAAIRTDVKALPTINENWIRGTDIMNLSCLWLVHKFKMSSLPLKAKQEAMYQTLMVLHYKLITSLMAHFFPYPVDESTSQMIYDELSLKYSLKKEGSWMAVLSERSLDILSDKSIHASTLTNFDDDAKIQYMVTDIQGRLRSLIKNLWVVLADIKERDIKRSKSTYFTEFEGELLIKDMSRQLGSYKLYMEKVVHDKQAFFKPELITVVSSLMTTMPPMVLNDTLIKFYEQYNKKNKEVIAFMNILIIHCFEQMANDPNVKKKVKTMPDFLAYMRSLYMASRSKGDVEKMRVMGEKFIKKHVRARNSSVIAAVRAGLMLYILLRMFSRDHYN